MSARKRKTKRARRTTAEIQAARRRSDAAKKAAATRARETQRRSRAAKRAAETRRRETERRARATLARKRSLAAKKGAQTRAENRKRGQISPTARKRLAEARADLLGETTIYGGGLMGEDREDWRVLRAMMKERDPRWIAFREWAEDEGYTYEQLAYEWFSPSM